MRLSGAVCLVTGASSGIGAATALALSRRGARVLVSGRHEGRLATVAREAGGAFLPVDLGSAEGTRALADWALAWAGRVDVLVNNAGIGWSGDFAGMPEDGIARLVAVNLTAPMVLTRLLLPGMCERGSGHVAMVSSIAGCVGVAREAAYAATKAGLNTFAESLRDEVGHGGVGVSVVVPGVVDTEFFTRRGTPYERARPRPIPAERVARAVVSTVERGRAQAFAPGWMRLPARVHGTVPGVFRRFAARATR